MRCFVVETVGIVDCRAKNKLVYECGRVVCMSTVGHFVRVLLGRSYEYCRVWCMRTNLVFVTVFSILSVSHYNHVYRFLYILLNMYTYTFYFIVTCASSAYVNVYPLRRFYAPTYCWAKRMRRRNSIVIKYIMYVQCSCSLSHFLLYLGNVLKGTWG